MKATITIPEDLERELAAYLETHEELLEETLQQTLREYLERRSLASLLGAAGLEYRLPRRPLASFTVAEKGSGKGDISINHDKYLAELP